MKLWLLVSLPLTFWINSRKRWSSRHISTDEMIPVIPGCFNLVQVHNTGAAFGMLKDNNLFFVALSFSALILLAILSWKGVFVDWTSRWAGALLVAGVAGNLTDRLLHGHVVDFLDVILPGMRTDGLHSTWPIPASALRQDCSSLVHSWMANERKLSHLCVDEISPQPLRKSRRNRVFWAHARQDTPQRGRRASSGPPSKPWRRIRQECVDFLHASYEELANRVLEGLR